MMPRMMAMMALALTVSGCATGDDPELLTGSTKPLAPTLEADVPSEYAAAYLPRIAGRVEGVRQSSRPNQIFQTVLYPNPGYGGGENRLTVSIAPPSSGSSYFQAPTQREIVSEMRKALPGAAMAIANAAGQNMHGLFGYAIGSAGKGGTCIFAWQTAREVSREPSTGFDRLKRSRYAAKIRLRYCHPTMTEASLVSLMAGLRIREISPTTLEMLRFAEGAGVAARPSYGLAQPETVKPRPVAARPVAAKPKRVARTTPVARTDAETTALLPAAPRVLKPGELTAYKNAQRAVPLTPEAVVAKPALALPGATQADAPDLQVKLIAPAVPLPSDLD